MTVDLDAFIRKRADGRRDDVRPLPVCAEEALVVSLNSKSPAAHGAVISDKPLIFFGDLESFIDQNFDRGRSANLNFIVETLHYMLEQLRALHTR